MGTAAAPRVIVLVESFHVNLLDAPNAPALLYWTWVLEPATVAEVEAHAPSARRNVVLLQVPLNVAITSDEAAAVVTYVAALPFKIPVAGENFVNVAARTWV